VIRFDKMIDGIGPALAAMAGHAKGSSSPIAIEATCSGASVAAGRAFGPRSMKFAKLAKQDE
jgi:hypothetical protein